MTRIEQIREMDLRELAEFLLTVGDFEPRGIRFCLDRKECYSKMGTEENPELPCAECMMVWLMEREPLQNMSGITAPTTKSGRSSDIPGRDGLPSAAS